jgi:Putative DNA-binding domain
MIPKSLNEVAEKELQALIAGGVREGRTIDYKLTLPGNTDAEKKEFLADASSFANTSGGDIVFGIDEDKGLPIQVTGVQSGDLDVEIRRLDSILASGLEPRIRYAIRPVICTGGKQVLVLRVERSWAGPHRVVFKGDDRFHARNSAGKYALDVNELRTAFTLSSTVTERIRAFRTDRIIALSNNQTPVPFLDDPKTVIHLIPIDSFASQSSYDLLPLYNNPALLRPMGYPSSYSRRLNLEGVITLAAPEPCSSYTQVYRTGIIEVVRGDLLCSVHTGEPTIPSIAYEQYIRDYLPLCLRILSELGVNIPVMIGLTLTQTRGLRMSGSVFDMHRGYPIEHDSIILPETIIQDLNTPVDAILKPMFDLVWNACGFPASRNYTADGQWSPRR